MNQWGILCIGVLVVGLFVMGFSIQEVYAKGKKEIEIEQIKVKFLAVDERSNTVTGVQCFVADSSGTTIVGPKGKEIWTDKNARVKIQFHWDTSEPLNQFVFITCFSRDVSGTQSFDTAIKSSGGYNEFVMDDIRGSEPISISKSNKNMILKGKKILENGRPAGLDECRITTKTSEGDPDRPIIIGSVPNSGVVKLFNISLDKILADVECKFEGEENFGEIIPVELKEKGTTVVIVSDPGSGIPSPG